MKRILTQKCELLETCMNAHIQLVHFSQVSVDRLYTSLLTPGRY